MRKLAFLILVISLIFPGAAIAQGEYQAVLLQPSLTSFPQIDTFLDVHAPDGSFVHGLDVASVQILEDGKTRQIDFLQELRLGVQISVAVNASPAFLIRNDLGISRFDTIRKYLEVLGNSQKDIAIDQLSLFTNSIVNQTQMTNSQAWLTALSTYQPDLKQLTPSLEPFSQAIQLALDTQKSPPIEKAILYFTPLPGEELSITVRDDLIARAKKAGVRCYIWMVAARNQFDEPSVEHLLRIADETGGQFIAFSGSEPFPDPQTILEPLRFLYQLKYTSGITQSGTHKMAARVIFQDSTAISMPISYGVNLLPVNPIFISVPSSIVRVSPSGKNLKNETPEPSNFTLEYLLEFPDSYPRELTKASLLVDEEIVASIESPPFNKFLWNLVPYEETGEHILQVEVTDQFGFVSRSAAVPVEVVADFSNGNWFTDITSSVWIYPILVIFFAAGVVAAVLYMNWRSKKPYKQARRQKSSVTNPVFPPVRENDPPVMPARIGIEPKKGEISQAWLEVVGENLEEAQDAPIELGESAQTWGNEQNQVDHWLNDPSLEMVHTRIWKDPNGFYLIADQRTRLGTWVNFAPIPADGVTLMHGDIIQIGDTRYRFFENPPRSIWQAEVQPYNYS